MEEEKAAGRALSVQGLIALWERLAAPRNSLLKKELYPLQKLCEAIKRFQNGRVEALVRRVLEGCEITGFRCQRDTI